MSAQMNNQVYKLTSRANLIRGDVFVLERDGVLTKHIVTSDWIDKHGQYCYTFVDYKEQEKI